jgi:hypothetical protein
MFPKSMGMKYLYIYNFVALRILIFSQIPKLAYLFLALVWEEISAKSSETIFCMAMAIVYFTRKRRASQW